MEEPDDDSDDHHWNGRHTRNRPTDDNKLKSKNEYCFCCYCRERKEKESRAAVAERKQQRKADAISVTLEKKHGKECTCSVSEDRRRCKRPPKKKEPMWRTTCSRCFSRKTQHKEPKSEIVRTKSWDLVNVFQHPRIPHTLDIRPVKSKHRKEKPKKSCPCKPVDEREAGGSCRPSFTCCSSAKQEPCADTVRTKPASILNVFQSPRIPNLIEIKPRPSESCPCVPTNKNPKVEEPSQTKPPDVEFYPKHGSCRPNLSCFNRSREEPCSNLVHTKPENILNMFQRPRIPNLIDGKQKTSVSELSLFDPCDDKANEVLNDPEPQLAEYYTKTKSVLTKPTNVYNVFQRPRIPDVMEHPFERRKHGMECTCSICEDRSRCRSPTKIKEPIWRMWRPNCSGCFSKESNTTKERTSQIVKTRPHDFANVLQHPRIPHSASTRPVKAQPQESAPKESCQCEAERKKTWNFLPSLTCCKSSEKEPSTDVVRTTPGSILNVPQRSRIPNQIGEVTQPPKPPYPSDTDEAKSICSRTSSQCLKSENVHTKPTNQLNIFQRPRIPNTIGVPWNKKKHSKECSCTICEDRSRCKPPRKEKEPIWKPSWPKCMSTVCSRSKDPMSEFVQTKPWDLANVFQHPRVLTALDTRPAKVKPEKEQSKETCPCKPAKERRKGGSCLPNLSCCKRRDEPTFEGIRTKPDNILNVFQRPRILHQIGYDSKPKQTCPCDLCNKKRYNQGLFNFAKCPRRFSCKTLLKRTSSDRLKCESVLTKPSNSLDLFQRPRIPAVISSSVYQEKHERDCKCSVCKDRTRCTSPPKRKEESKRQTTCSSCFSRPVKSPKESTADFVKTKPWDISSMFQHPRITNPVESKPHPIMPRKEKHRETCPCSKCDKRRKGGSCLSSLSCSMSTNRLPSTEFVRTKPSNLLNMLQRPRIPSAIGSLQSNGTSGHKIGRRCSCDICKEKMRCETAYKRRKWTTTCASCFTKSRKLCPQDNSNPQKPDRYKRPESRRRSGRDRCRYSVCADKSQCSTTRRDSSEQVSKSPTLVEKPHESHFPSNANRGGCCRCIICEDKIQCAKMPEDLNDNEVYYPKLQPKSHATSYTDLNKSQSKSNEGQNPTVSPSSTTEFNTRHCNCARCRDRRKPGD